MFMLSCLFVFGLVLVRVFVFCFCRLSIDRSIDRDGICRAAKKDCPDMDPMFVVRCWNRVRGHILREALPEESGGGGGEHTVSCRGNREGPYRIIAYYYSVGVAGSALTAS